MIFDNTGNEVNRITFVAENWSLLSMTRRIIIGKNAPESVCEGLFDAITNI